MSTPVCRSCQTKFPGKEICKSCGSDPNAEPTLAYKIQRELAKKVKVVTEVKVVSNGDWLVIDELHVWKDRSTIKARAARRARIRSLKSSMTSGRRNKHGRIGVR